MAASVPGVRSVAELSTSDIEGMSLDPQGSDPHGYNGYQSPRDLVAEPETDEQDPATPGGPAPYNGVAPFGRPVTTDPGWTDQQHPPTQQPYTPTPYAGPGPGVDTTILHEARRGPTEETMTADLWTLASADAEAEQAAVRMVQAKVATSPLWPFLAGAGSEVEFGHRMALCRPQLERHFPEDGWRAQVTAALHEDFRILKGLPEKDAASESDREPGKPTGAGPAENPYYFLNDEPEAGPLSAPAESGHFAQDPGPEPWNPMNAQYPMQPSAWTVPPDKAWVENPMQGMRTGSVVDGGSGVLPEEDEDNPGTHYFSGGQEGVAGDQQAGFPVDVSLPEPDEGVDRYGTVPPQESQNVAPQSYTNQPRTGRFILSERDNHGACAYGDCGGPVYRDGDTWKHLNGDPGHKVHLHRDHPWVRGQEAGRVMAAQRRVGEYHYVHPNPNGDGFVITQKDTGKILSHHDTREDAEAAFRAMMTHKHSTQGRWKVADLATDTGPDASSPSAGADTGGTDTTTAPGPPSSMTPGGAGAEAMPPLTIPNANVTTNPFATGKPSSDTSNANAANPFQAVKTADAQVKERPTSTSPLGVADEYQANTWENPANQRPLQSSEDRNINTPQVPQQAIPVRSSDGAPEEPENDEGDED